MNRAIRRVGIAITVLLLALVGQLTWLQVVQADKLADDPRNVRNLLRDLTRERGRILASDGTILAESIEVDDEFEYQRVYPQPDLYSHITGYQSIVVGSTGVENSYNDILIGRDTDVQIRGLDVESIRELLSGKQEIGNVVLSVRPDLQQVARDALAGRAGSVVALDPRTGGILAMYSNPTYDPNALAVHDAEAATDAFELLNAVPDQPLLPTTYRERFAPGSTFKVVTTAIGLDDGVTTPETVYPSISELDLPLSDRTLSNFGGSTCGGTLEESFVRSCNTTFAQIGLDLGDRLAVGIDEFGITSAPPLDLRPGGVPGSAPAPGTFEQGKPFFALAAIGQGDVFATPLHMTLVAASVANGGVMPSPHVGAEIRDGEDRLVRRVEPGPWRTVMTPETAATLRDLMVQVVERGTGTAAQIAGVTVGGKTGTAEVGEGLSPNAWFIGFAPADNPVIAVAVMVEGAGSLGSEATGGRVAAPVAREVMARALGL